MYSFCKNEQFPSQKVRVMSASMMILRLENNKAQWKEGVQFLWLNEEEIKVYVADPPY